MNRNAFRVPINQPGSRMPQYNQQQLPAAPGADVSARLSDSAGQIMAQGADQQAKGLEMLGRGMQQAAKAGYDLYTDYQTTKAKEAWLTYKQEAARKQADLDTQLQGKDAIDPEKGVMAQMKTWREQTRQELSSTLGGMAAGMFNNAAADTDASMDAWAVRKVHQEGVNYGNAIGKARMAEAQQNALAVANDPEAFGAQMGIIRAETEAMAKRNGYDQEWTTATFNGAQREILVHAVRDRIKSEQLGQADSIMKKWSPLLGSAVGGLRAEAAAKGRELQARARAESERAEGEATISAVTGLLKDTAGLSVKERETEILARVAEVPDLKMRHRMASLAKSELAFEDLRVTAQTEKQVLDFYDNTKGMTPVQQMRDLETRTDLSDAAREKLRSKLNTDWHRETPQNQTALSGVMLNIDKAKAAGTFNIDANVYKAAADKGLTPEQTKKAIKYAQEGGSAGSLKFSEANNIWKRLTGKKEMPVEAFETLRTQLPQGREATTADIERALSNFYMSGKTAGSGWFSDGENYLGALKHGRGGTWLPNVTDQEKKEISNILKSSGMVVTLEKIRRYKKQYIMGIPEEDGGIK